MFEPRQFPPLPIGGPSAADLERLARVEAHLGDLERELEAAERLVERLEVRLMWLRALAIAAVVVLLIVVVP